MSKIESYREKIKYLKTKLKNLSKNKEILLSKLNYIQFNPPTSIKKQIPEINSDNIDNEIIKIQSNIRGFLFRKNLNENFIERANLLSKRFKNPLYNFSIYRSAISKLFEFLSQKCGITFEMLFRMLDKNSNNIILTEDFENQIKKMNTELKNSDITRISLIFDENFDGIISKENFHENLAYFGFASEKCKYSKEEFLYSFLDSLISKNMNLIQIWSKINEKNIEYIIYEEFELFYKFICDKPLKIGQFNTLIEILDEKSEGKIYKNKFIESIYLLARNNKNRIKVKIIDQFQKDFDSLTIRNNSKRISNLNKNNRKEEENINDINDTFNVQIEREGGQDVTINKQENKNNRIEEKNIDDANDIFKEQIEREGDQGLVENKVNTDKKLYLNNLSAEKLINSAIEKSNIPFCICFEDIISNAKDIKNGFTYLEIYNKLKQYYGKYLDKEYLNKIIIDVNHKSDGKYGFLEISNCFKKYCGSKMTVNLLLMLFVKDLEIREIKSETLFEMNKINLDKTINFADFINEIMPIMKLEYEEMELIFLNISNKFSNDLNLREFINRLNSLRQDVTINKTENKNNNLRKFEKNLEFINNQKIFEKINEFKIILSNNKIDFELILSRTKDPKTNKISLLKLNESLRRLLPKISPSKIISWLNLIDLNQDGFLEPIELALCLDNGKNIKKFDSLINDLKINIEEINYIKNDFITYLEQNSININEFCKIIFIDDDLKLNYIEFIQKLMKFGFPFNKTIKILKIMDLSKDGFIEENEFVKFFETKTIEKENLNPEIFNLNLKQNEIIIKLDKKKLLEKTQKIILREFKEIEKIKDKNLKNNLFIDYFKKFEFDQNELIFLVKIADYENRGIIIMKNFIDFVIGTDFRNEKNEEFDKMEKFLEKEKNINPFFEEKHKEKDIVEKNVEKNSEEQNFKEIEVKTEEFNKKKIIDEKKKIDNSFSKQTLSYPISIVSKYISEERREEALKYIRNKNDIFLNQNFENCTIFVKPIACLQRCLKIYDECENSKTRYEDKSFGSNAADPQGLKALYKSIYDKTLKNRQIYWKRPEEIVYNPIFISNIYSPIIQGETEDAWFLEALFLTSSRSNLIINNEDNFDSCIYPEIFKYFSKIGLYIFRFFKSSKPVYVLIDDKLPCILEKNGNYSLINGGNINEREFWVALIEKAYAKLHNCYENLKSGIRENAIIDLTGFYLIEKNIELINNKENFYNFLKENNERNSVIGFSLWVPEIEKEKKYCVTPNMIFSLINMIEIEDNSSKNSHKSHRLILLRNVENNIDFQGEWDNLSKKRNKFEKIINDKFQFFEKDTEIIMRFKEIRSCFNSLLLFKKHPLNFLVISIENKWSNFKNTGVFDPKKPKNYCKNPQFYFKLNKNSNLKTKIFIEIHQFDYNLEKKNINNELDNIFFAIYNNIDGKIKKLLIREQKNEVLRSEFIKKLHFFDDFELVNGNYIFLIGNQNNNSQGNIVLNLYLDCSEAEIEYNALFT